MEMDAPRQMLASEGFTVTVGLGVTLTVVIALVVQVPDPAASTV
jgi:hypothetical protein